MNFRNLPGNDHELLESHAATSVGATVEDVHEGDGQDVGLLGASQVGDVSVERDTLLGGSGLGNGHGDTEDGVGTKLSLVLGSIKLVEESVDGGLVLDVDVLLDQSRGDLLVDVGNGLGDTLATPLALVTIAELASLVGAGGGAGGDDGAVKASLGDDVDLDGGVTLKMKSASCQLVAGQVRRGGTYARVVDGAGVDLGDGHDVCVCTGLISKESIAEAEVELRGSRVYIGDFQPYEHNYSVLVKRHWPVLRWVLKKHTTAAQPWAVRGRRSLKLAWGHWEWDDTAGRGWEAAKSLTYQVDSVKKLH